MNHFSKVCLSRKDSLGTVHFAEEANAPINVKPQGGGGGGYPREID